MINHRGHTDEVIAALEAVGLVVGDHEAPEGAGRQGDGSFDPYVVVYRIPGGNRSGSLEDPAEDGEFIYQVTCVGGSRRQAEWALDKTEVLFEGLEVDGRAVTVVPHENPGTPREDDVTPAIFTATPRFRLMSTPS